MILVGYDGSKQSTVAVRWAARIAAVRGEPLRVTSAVPLPVSPGAEYLPAGSFDDFVGEAQKLAAEGAGLARTEGAEEVTTEGVASNPAFALVEASEQASLIVVGNRGHHEFVETMLGSVGYAVAGHARCPAVIVRGEVAEPLGRIVVAYDRSEPAGRAVAFAADLAAVVGASIQLVGAWTDPAITYGLPMYDESAEIAQAVDKDLQDARASVLSAHGDLQVTTQTVRGDASVEIGRIAEGAGLLVVGNRGRGGFRSLVLGSVSRRLVATAPCPVAVVR